MKRVMICSALALGLVAAPVFADKSVAPDRKAAEAKCERWAKEHKISDAEKKTYIKDCVRDQVVAEPKKEGGGDE